MKSEVIHGILITTEMCHNCKMLKDWLEERCLSFEKEYFAENHMDLCRKHSITTAPSLLIEETGEVFRGNMEIQDYLRSNACQSNVSK